MADAPQTLRRGRQTQAPTLARLGIDVWVRHRPAAARARSAQRDAGTATPQARGGIANDRVGNVQRAARHAPKAGVVAPVAPAKPRPRASAAPQPAPSTPKEQAAPVAPFRIRCFRYGDVFIALAEDAWPHQRLVLDVALALNRFQPAERSSIDFAWPLPGAAPDGAERAFRAFFGHQTRNDPRTLIAGGRVAQLLGAEPPSNCAIVSGHLYIPPRRLDASAKAALWGLIQKHWPASG